jgi:hypothetical protein
MEAQDTTDDEMTSHCGASQCETHLNTYNLGIHCMKHEGVETPVGEARLSERIAASHWLAVASKTPLADHLFQYASNQKRQETSGDRPSRSREN